MEKKLTQKVDEMRALKKGEEITEITLAKSGNTIKTFRTSDCTGNIDKGYDYCDDTQHDSVRGELFSAAVNAVVSGASGLKR